jgi:hypothetical protein
MKTKGSIFFSAIKSIVKALWMLLLLLLYAVAKLAESISGFLSKVFEKLLNTR